MNTTALAAHGLEQRVLDVFARHVAAFNSGEIDAVLGDFGEHSVVITADGIYEGLAQIRTFYQGLLAQFGVVNRGDSPGFTFDNIQVRHNTLYFTWQAESLRHVFPFGTDTCICNGKTFERQTIAYSPPQAKDGTVAGAKHSTR